MMVTLQPIRTRRRVQAGFKTMTCLALLVALMMGIALTPATALAAKKHASENSLYQPPDKLRRDRRYAPEEQVELTATGKALADKYATMLSELRAELIKQLPQIDTAKQKACQRALAAQLLASVDDRIARTRYRRGYLNKVTGLKPLEQKLADAPGRLADAQLLLKHALAMSDDNPDKTRAVKEAQLDLAKRKEDLEKLPNAVAKAKSSIESAKQNEPELTKQLEAADKAFEQAQANSAQAFKDLGVDGLLASDSLDAKLAKFVVISDESPYWLAVYAQQGPEQAKIVDQLLADPALMIQMLVADGPTWGKFGRAIETYQKIQKVSPKTQGGLFQKLALAVALANAQPIVQSNPEADKNAPPYVDPVNRYLSYEEAYLAHELDPAFDGFSTWDLRMVVNGNEPDQIAAWGRKMLRSYRPDLISMRDYDWRYVKSVVTSVNYTSTYQHLGWDRPDLEEYQNILANGGVCGRRAFFGRFILRAFGIPTAARPQPGHASLVHWTPDGWVDCLGGGWGAGKSSVGGYPTGLDFLASTQARDDKQAFMQVKRAGWIGQVFGEAATCGYHVNLKRRYLGKFAKQSVDQIQMPGFWHTAAMIKQNMIIKMLKAKAPDSVGENLGEADSGEGVDTVDAVKIPDAQRQITVDSQGTIHIPAAACSHPTSNTDVIRFMPSVLGGWQMNYSRFGGAATFAYTFDAPRAGKYQFTARLVTPGPKQHLYLTVNNAKEPINITLPYTIGMWGELKPVEIELVKGKNVLSFCRDHFFMKGVAIRDFKLTPVH